jgi:hypothetical protein
MSFFQRSRGLVKSRDEGGIQDLPSLIDLVFLLLIFSLTTMSQNIVKMREKAPSEIETLEKIELPIYNDEKAKTADEKLKTLFFQIERDTLVAGKCAIYALWPSNPDSSTFNSSKQQAIRTGLWAVFTDSILQMQNKQFALSSPCTLIANTIRRYKNSPNLARDRVVGIRADGSTEFRIINFLMTECSQYGDTIPRVVIRTFQRQG